MKLITRKLQYRKRNKPLILAVFLLIFLFFSFAGHSQHFPFKFTNIPVSDALLEVAKTSDIRIAFDNDRLNDFKITKEINLDDIESILSTILTGTGYQCSFKHNTWIIYKKSATANKEQDLDYRISGIIFDKKSGERLPYATLFLKNDNNVLPATVDGTFSTKVSNTSDLHIQISFLGYQTLDTSIVNSGSNKVLHLGLSQKHQNIATINVEGNNLELLEIDKTPGHFSFNPYRSADLPNYGETDIFRALQLLPGISAQENSSQLNIRGSSADQNLVMFDGFTLYNLDHFFGVFSAINPNVVKDIQVFRGGFDSSYGERVSGIIDITGKSGNKTEPQFYGGINTISANLTAEIPISKKLTLVAAARRSYSDAYSSWLADAILADKIGQARRFPGADNVIEPKFYFGDFNTKLTWSPDEQNNISLSVYGAEDYLNSSNFSERNAIAINTEDTNEWGNYGVGLSWKRQHGTKYFTNLQMGHSGYYNNYFNNTSFASNTDNENTNANIPKDQITNEENDLIDYFITFKNTYFLSKSNHLEFGASAKYNEFRFNKEAENDLIYNNLNSSGILYAAFLQDQITLSKKLILKPGFRVNYYDQTKKIYFEPRLSANYLISDKLYLKLATGRYYQFLNKPSSEQSYGYNRDFWVLSDDETHPVVSSNHYIIGAGFETKTLYFDIEAYYKTVNGLQEYLFFLNPEDAPHTQTPSKPADKEALSKFVSGTGKAIGIDFLLKYENTNFTSWLAYSISKSTRNFDEINNGDNIPVSFDQTHEIKWTNIYSYQRWNFSTLALYTTGHPYIETTEKDEDFNTIRSYNRLPDYFRVDLSLNYNFNIKNVNIKPGFSILNAFNTENYLDIYNRDFSFQNNEFRETTLVKAQDLTLNFFVNFRF